MNRVSAIVLASVLVLAASAAAQEEATSAKEQFRRALALHDAGQYDAAIAIYKQLLAATPDDDQVAYELTFTTFAKGDMAETIRLAKKGGDKAGPNQVYYLEMLGNAYDAQHQTREAIDVYKRGISINPDYPRIHLNLGVAYAGQKRLREAREELERAIALDPNYASAHFAIGEIYRIDGYRIPALFAYGRLLSLERNTPRAAAAAKNLQALLNLGVTAEKPGNVNITIDPSAKKDLGDFSALAMMAALTAGSTHLPEKAAMSEFDRESEALGSFLTMVSEVAGELKQGFVGKTYVPFYADMVKAGHSSAFAHLALGPLKLAGTDDWLTAHQADLSGLDQWLQERTRK